MAVKTFTAGDVLTASDTNTYLANAGLVYISSTTIGSAVTSVTVSNCFSSTYDNYKILVNGGTSSVAGSIAMQLSNSTGSTYQTFGYYGNFGSAPNVSYAPSVTTSWADALVGGTTMYAGEITVFGPFLSAATIAFTSSISTVTSYQFQLRDTSTASSTGFKFTPNSGTMTGGTIRVYGIRQA